MSLIGVSILRVPAQLADPNLWTWVVMVAVIELFPVATNEGMTFTVSDPLLFAFGMTHDPLVTVTAAWIASFDPRELRRELSVPRSLFNRSQIALGYGFASQVFHWMGATTADLPLHLGAAVVMSLVFYPFNLSMVAIAAHLRLGLPFRRVVRGLLMNSPLQSGLAYLSLGFMGALAARLYFSVQPGIVALGAFALPLLFLARFTFLHIREAQAESLRAQRGEARFRRLAEESSDERVDERLQLAGLLHDEVVPIFEGINLLAGTANRLSAVQKQSDRDGALQEIRRAGQRGGELLREIVNGLRNSLGPNGLPGALQGLVAEAVGTAPSVQLKMIGEVTLGAEREFVIFQIAREAVSNAVKHSGGTNVQVTLEAGSEGWELSVADDGIGFDPDIRPQNHFGIDLMRERALRLGAEISYIRTPAGMEVRVRKEGR